MAVKYIQQNKDGNWTISNSKSGKVVKVTITQNEAIAIARSFTNTEAIMLRTLDGWEPASSFTNTNAKPKRTKIVRPAARMGNENMVQSTSIKSRKEERRESINEAAMVLASLKAKKAANALKARQAAEASKRFEVHNSNINSKNTIRAEDENLSAAEKTAIITLAKIHEAIDNTLSQNEMNMTGGIRHTAQQPVQQPVYQQPVQQPVPPQQPVQEPLAQPAPAPAPVSNEPVVTRDASFSKSKLSPKLAAAAEKAKAQAEKAEAKARAEAETVEFNARTLAAKAKAKEIRREGGLMPGWVAVIIGLLIVGLFIGGSFVMGFFL